ncbi:RNA-binding protein [Streptomyces sp. CC53]|uniref:TROVE domain-containing protein n=1 Tax=Streptomyces sp. CC53 TaxID=1906740 RepID=UPI0008DCEC68|nr:TROVE domain-containing protein [Streptomyces sp. CC53]OII61154.1 RNA-binding protein [Streptomyces sp. CC53]
MSRFNHRGAKAAGQSPITTTTQALTHEGGSGYHRDEKSELFLLAVANLVSQDAFYETGGERDNRYQQLIRHLAVTDPDWTVSLLTWLRSSAGMRTASLIGAAEYVKARLDKGIHGDNRQIIDMVCKRPDEPGELLAYWHSRYGRALPMPVKRGLADAVQRLYGERSLLKYDTASHAYRFADVIELVHPTPKAPWQSDLFRYAIDRRHKREDPPPESLEMIRHNAWLRDKAGEEPEIALNATHLAQAGMTWEDALSAVGSKVDKAALWEAMIPSMGYMALLRNLRNFDEAGVSDTVAAGVAARIGDPGEVERSQQFPMRFLSAYRAAPSLRWSWALEKALNLSLANVPRLRGRTLVLVDRSASMFWAQSKQSQLTFADTAAVFGTAVAVRAENATLVQYGSLSEEITLPRGISVLKAIERYRNMGGTNTVEAVRQHFQGHDRVVIVTDEQAYPSYYGSVDDVLPDSVPLYTWNLAGYRVGHGRSGSGNRYTFGGLSDAAFRMIPLLEAGRNADWPWVG